MTHEIFMKELEGTLKGHAIGDLPTTPIKSSM